MYAALSFEREAVSGLSFNYEISKTKLMNQLLSLLEKVLIRKRLEQLVSSLDCC